MESQSLEKASQYLNNLLLARGLLSNCKPIDFARPDRHGSNTDATMSRVINLVHDLVVRRDQDADQREALTIHIHKARTIESERALEVKRLKDTNAELGRAVAAAESQERTLKANIRKLEAQARELKEQMLKMKSTLDQVRAKCLSDVRKRDTELDKLKAHLAGMQRGKKESSGMKINTINWEPEIRGREKRNGQDVDSSEWSLEKESNDFLAELVNETSTENVSLRRIITDTMEILQDLTGLAEQQAASEQAADDEEDGIGIPGQYRKSRRKAAEAQQQAQAEIEGLTACDELAQHMTTILEHCQSILKDPSFVPLEEVQVRDEEIIKLRLGWEKMASRWKEAVTMMDNWRKGMTEHGESLSRDDLSRLEFGKSVAMLPNGQPVFGEDEELSSVLYENSRLEEVPEEDEVMEQEEADVHYPELPKHDNIESQFVEQEAATNAKPLPSEGRSPKRRASLARKAGLNIGKPTRPLQPLELNLSPRHATVATSPKSSSRQSADSGLGSSESAMEVDDGPADEEEDVWLDENLTRSRIPRKIRRQEPIMTISEKLAAAEAEAAEAQRQPPSSSHTEATGKKRKYGANGAKIRKANRRRSTLSPEELAELMGIE
ncbi:hypothetical protein H2200_009595 [Cladophialophora chaetospira]|uniref:NIMA interactive protein n=1 Tax=Cladophialophora chaetospira TaxID=386627 RepID=A0AA38X2Q6_9EURO|nr:hypothetical protein H2200_009595 [Cladophialophora chaetospira]